MLKLIEHQVDLTHMKIVPVTLYSKVILGTRIRGKHQVQLVMVILTQ